MCNEIIVFHFCEKVRDCYNNLNEKNICDNRKFWKVVKPLLSNKIASNEKIAISRMGRNYLNRSGKGKNVE